MSEIRPKTPMTLTERVVQLVRCLGNPSENEAMVTLRMLRELLGKNKLDFHVIADRYKHGDGEPLSAAEMQALYDKGFQDGHARGTEQGRHSAILAAQPMGVFAASVENDVNGYSWQQIAQHCLTNKHLFHGRDLEFVESVAESLTRFSTPTPKQAKWLRDLFVRKFGGRIE